uniref:Uncharacterized protein n=1 Tax=Glossina pallidipes TaxID=7398 RepID=A0A1A9ZRP2_GLOPL
MQFLKHDTTDFTSSHTKATTISYIGKHLERSTTQLKNHKTAKKHNKQLNPFAEGNTQFITWFSTPPQQHARKPQHEYHSGHIRTRSEGSQFRTQVNIDFKFPDINMIHIAKGGQK